MRKNWQCKWVWSDTANTPNLHFWILMLCISHCQWIKNVSKNKTKEVGRKCKLWSQAHCQIRHTTSIQTVLDSGQTRVKTLTYHSKSNLSMVFIESNKTKKDLSAMQINWWFLKQQSQRNPILNFWQIWSNNNPEALCTQKKRQFNHTQISCLSENKQTVS